jgi:hypothetical protein
VSPTVYRQVRHPRGGVGSKCLHCKRNATWHAMRYRNGMVLPVAYCDEHAAVAGVAR